MDTLLDGLRECLQGRTLVLGIGNELYGDDGVGVCLAGRLGGSPCPGPTGSGTLAVAVAGPSPERFLGDKGRWDNVVFADAVEMGAPPGSAALMSADEIECRFPQVSTHKLSLGMLARYTESETGARAWLLGVQPASLAPGAGLSAPVAATVDALVAAVASVRVGSPLGKSGGIGPDGHGAMHRGA